MTNEKLQSINKDLKPFGINRHIGSKLVIEAEAGSKTPAEVGFNQTQYFKSFNQKSWKVKTQEYFAPALRRGFQITKPLDKTLERNLIDLLTAINALRKDYGKPMIVSSGYRSPEHNAKVGGATHSTHQSCQAIDIVDADGSLRRFCTNNNNAILKKYNLFMEHPAYTKGWCHLQIKPAKSGNVVFIPYASKPKDGHHDISFKI